MQLGGDNLNQQRADYGEADFHSTKVLTIRGGWGWPWEILSPHEVPMNVRQRLDWPLILRGDEGGCKWKSRESRKLDSGPASGYRCVMCKSISFSRLQSLSSENLVIIGFEIMVAMEAFYHMQSPATPPSASKRKPNVLLLDTPHRRAVLQKRCSRAPGNGLQSDGPANLPALRFCDFLRFLPILVFSFIDLNPSFIHEVPET